MLGDDAARCSNGLTAQKFREATAEEQVTYRKWMRGMVFFYGALLRRTSPFTLLLGLSVIGVFVGQGVGVWLWRRRFSGAPATVA